MEESQIESPLKLGSDFNLQRFTTIIAYHITGDTTTAYDDYDSISYHTYSVAGPYACNGRGILPKVGLTHFIFPKMCPPSTYAWTEYME